MLHGARGFGSLVRHAVGGAPADERRAHTARAAPQADGIYPEDVALWRRHCAGSLALASLHRGALPAASAFWKAQRRPADHSLLH